MDIENNVSENATPVSEDELKNAIEEQLSKVRSQSMLLGAQAVLKVVLDKVVAFENSPSKKTNNDHKRLIKDIKNFCQIGLSRKVNFDGTTEVVEDSTDKTVQN